MPRKIRKPEPGDPEVCRAIRPGGKPCQKRPISNGRCRHHMLPKDEDLLSLAGSKPILDRARAIRALPPEQRREIEATLLSATFQAAVLADELDYRAVAALYSAIAAGRREDRKDSEQKSGNPADSNMIVVVPAESPGWRSLYSEPKNQPEAQDQ